MMIYSQLKNDNFIEQFESIRILCHLKNMVKNLNLELIWIYYESTRIWII